MRVDDSSVGHEALCPAGGQTRITRQKMLKNAMECTGCQLLPQRGCYSRHDPR